MNHNNNNLMMNNNNNNSTSIPPTLNHHLMNNNTPNHPFLGSSTTANGGFYNGQQLLGGQQQQQLYPPPTTTNNLLSSSSMLNHPNHLHHLNHLLHHGGGGPIGSSYPPPLSSLSSNQSNLSAAVPSHPSSSLSNLVEAAHQQPPNTSTSSLLDQSQQLSFNHVRGTTTTNNPLLMNSHTGLIQSSSSNNNLAKLNTLKNISHHELPINEFNSSSLLNEQDAPPVPPTKTESTISSSSSNNNEKAKPSSVAATTTNTNNNNNMANMQKEMSNMMKRPRRVAKLACVSCRKAHACCEDKRPCSRCLAHGLECQDQVGKKRGRKKKSGEDDNDEDDDQPIEKPSSSTIETATSSGTVAEPSSASSMNATNNNNNNTATTSTSSSSATTTNVTTTATTNDKKKKKKKKSSPKKKKEKQSAQSSTSNNNHQQVKPETVASSSSQPIQTAEKEQQGSGATPSTAVQSNQRLQQVVMNPNLVNTLQQQQHLTESELKTPGAMLTSGNNVIFPNRDNHPLSLPFLLNQPPEIQQLTQILMRTPVDTFYLHCNNLNSAYDYQNNQSLFGTPYSLNVDESILHHHHQQQQQYLNNLNNLNNMKLNNQHHHHQLVSPGAGGSGVASPLIDFTSDEFLRFSPQSPMFASIVEMDPHEIHNEVGHIMPSFCSTPTTTTTEDERNKSSNNVNTNDDVQIEDCEDSSSNAQKAATTSASCSSSSSSNVSNNRQEEEIFERLKKMSNEEMIKSLQIGDDTKQMIEESIGHLKQFDSNPETANMTYIEYLTQNFPISLLLKHKLNDSAKKLATSNETIQQGTDIQKEIESLREENKRLKEENLRKANESAMLSAINENLRNRFSELASKGIIKMQYDEPPTYGENNKPTAIQDSYQELVMLMENKQEMDSSDFGIILMFPGGRIISLNRTLLTKLNYDPSDLYDNLERWEDVVHPESYPQIIAHVSRVLKTPPAPRKSFKCKVNCRRRGGGMIPAELYLCIVGGKFSYIPVFAIGYFLFEDSQKPGDQQDNQQQQEQ